MKNIRVLGLALFAGASLTLAQQPYGFWPLSFVGVGCFIYLIHSYRENRDRIYLFSSSIGWMLYACWMCWWISYFGTVALIAFALANAITWIAFVYAATLLIHKIPRSLYYAFGWVLFEYVMSFIPIIAFTWLSVSTPLVDVSFARSLARVGGAQLITFTVVLSAASCAIGVWDRHHDKKLPRRIRTIFVGLLMCGFLATSYLVSLIHFSSSSTVSVATVQGNNLNRNLTLDEQARDYLGESHINLAKDIVGHPDIIVFPESAFPHNPFNIDDDEVYYGIWQELAEVAAKARSLVIVNAIASDDGAEYNRNYLVTPSMRVLGTYDKHRLVPFGEYIPFNSLIGNWSMFDEIGTRFTPGNKYVTKRGVTTIICYESAFTRDAFNALDAGAKLLVVTTNNRSYQRSGNSAQHLDLSRMRAAEYGISVVHASVSGHSALIKNDGTVLKESSLFTREILQGSLAFGRPNSFYARYGCTLSVFIMSIVLLYFFIQLVRAEVRVWRKVDGKIPHRKN